MRASHLLGSGDTCPHSHPDKPCMSYVFVEYARIPLESQNPRRVEKIVPEIRSWERQCREQFKLEIRHVPALLVGGTSGSYKSSSIRMDSVIHLDLGDAAAPEPRCRLMWQCRRTCVTSLVRFRTFPA